jgi:hypothetical protein
MLVLTSLFVQTACLPLLEFNLLTVLYISRSSSALYIAFEYIYNTRPDHGFATDDVIC